MINVGVLGFAQGHVMNYGKVWMDNPEYGVQIVAGYDHDAERLAKSCEVFNAKACASPEELLACDISAVVISAETKFHAELVELAAAAKKDIILYKPMALTLAEADRIVDAVNKNGVRFTMGWQMRVDPQNLQMKALIDSGELGDLTIYRRRHSLNTHEWDNFGTTSWHASAEYNRDIFADDSSHPINMMQWIFGMPETVSCEMSTIVDPTIRNDSAVALFKYKSGMIAEITCQFTCPTAEITTEVYGSKGVIQQYFGDLVSTRLPHSEQGLKWFKLGDEDWTVSDIPSPKAHGARIGWQAEPLAKFLKGERETICSAEEGRDSLRLVLACYLSAQLGQRVSVWDERIYDI